MKDVHKKERKKCKAFGKKKNWKRNKERNKDNIKI